MAAAFSVCRWSLASSQPSLRMFSFFLAWNQLLQRARSSLVACGVSGHLGYGAGPDSHYSFCGDFCWSQCWTSKVTSASWWLVHLLYVMGYPQWECCQLRGRYMLAARIGGTCTDFIQDIDALYPEKCTFGGSWCCRQHLSVHWSLERVEVSFQWCGYDKTGYYMLSFLTSGSLFYIKKSWFIENNPNFFNQSILINWWVLSFIDDWVGNLLSWELFLGTHAEERSISQF